MVKVIMYSTDKIDYNILKTYCHQQYTPIAYGNIHNKWWYIFGDFDYEIYKPEKNIYKNEKAYEHLTKKAITSMTLLTLCNHFEKHIKSSNSDIEVEGIGKGNFITNINYIINSCNIHNVKNYSDETISVYCI